MKKVSKIIIICVLITITLSTIFFLNKKEVKSNGMFAIMLEKEKGTGKYEHAKDNRWPQSDEYVINMYKTYCEKGSVLRWNNETKKINATVKGTDKCYVYFDLSEYGDEEHPYLIQTIEDLVRLSNDVNSGTTYAGKYFLLTTDLDFNDESDYEDANRTDFKDINGINGDEPLIKELTTGTGFIPIGYRDYYKYFFAGNFNGNNHTLKNLYIINDTNSSRLGLFGVTKGANISNLTITGNLKSNAKANIGGFVGDAYSTTLVNVHNEAKITSTSKDWDAAGLMGAVMEETKIINSTNKGAIEGGHNSAGFIGYINSGAVVSIKNSNNEGNISNENTTTGGLVGINSGDLIIDTCYNIGNITNGINVGGLVGHNSGTLTLDESYNSGIIQDNYNSVPSIGGIIGLTTNIFSISNSYNSGVISLLKNGTEIDYDNAFMGGLIGQISFNSTNIKGVIDNSSNKSDGVIKGSNKKGGLIGDIINSNIEITNSYNLASFNDYNDAVGSYYSYGGLIGHIGEYSIVSIKKSYNEGNLKIVQTNLEQEKEMHLGGLVGYAFVAGDASGKVIKLTIEDSYNIGNLSNETKSPLVGGIIAYNNSCNLTLNRVFNQGNLSIDVFSNSPTFFNKVGGLVGIIYAKSKVNILNSYNLGNINYIEPLDIKSGWFGGLIGYIQAYLSNDIQQNTINSYNVGYVKSPNVSSGILTSSLTNLITEKISNVYSIGNLKGTEVYGIGQFPNSENYIKNVYYLNTFEKAGNIENSNFLSKSIVDIKQQAFVDELNKNVESINLEEIDESLKDYKLSKWTLGSGGYPTLIND